MDGSQVRAPDGADRGATSGDGLSPLFARFDPLLRGETLAPAEVDEMRALARIYDLNDDAAAPGEVWARLREVMVKSAPVHDAEAGHGRQDRALTLLVVEDDPMIAQTLVDALIEAGHAVIGPAATAEAAAALASQHAVDVALLDINLDGPATGVDLARDLKARWGAPSVFLSGDVSQAARHADLASQILVKPYRVAEVLRAVQAVAR